MKFVAIDVETANPRMSSICQIGVVTFEDGKEVSAESRLLDPQDYFDPYHMSVHGISEEHVAGAPRFRDLHDWLHARTDGAIVACHTHFDRTAVNQACAADALQPLQCQWLDTARVARRAWPEFALSGYGLSSLAKHFSIPLKHHDALEDARAAGLILLRAMNESGLNATEWIERCALKSNPGAPQNIRREGDGDGPLVGERIVFTGALQILRRDAADMAHEAGAAVDSGITKHTTLLVVGDQDIARLNGQDKSSKHRKAEQLIGAGRALRILGERDFMTMCAD